MNDDRNDDLTASERAALGALRRDRQPPAAVEQRVLQAIGARAAAERPRRLRPLTYTALAAAASFVLGVFLGSMLHGSPSAPAPATTQQGAEFMLLLYEDESFQQATDRDARVQEYVDWAGSLAQQGRLVAGDELGVGGMVVAPASAAVPLDAAATADQPQGYFLIRADDEAHAARLASTCPHVRYGGTIVVRRLTT